MSDQPLFAVDRGPLTRGAAAAVGAVTALPRLVAQNLPSRNTVAAIGAFMAAVTSPVVHNAPTPGPPSKVHASFGLRVGGPGGRDLGPAGPKPLSPQRGLGGPEKPGTTEPGHGGGHGGGEHGGKTPERGGRRREEGRDIREVTGRSDRELRDLEDAPVVSLHTSQTPPPGGWVSHIPETTSPSSPPKDLGPQEIIVIKTTDTGFVARAADTGGWGI